jgi:hypothetical protein
VPFEIEENMPTTNATATGTGFVSSVIGWAKQPFTSGGSALNWVLFVGLLVIAAWFWNHILMSITD